MTVTNTQATNKTQIIPNYPDSPLGTLYATLLSHVAVSSANELFQGGERVSRGQTYACTLNSAGIPDGTAHASGWFLPTPDTTGAGAWRYSFEIVDASGNRRVEGEGLVSYSASSQNLSTILAAGASSEDADPILAALAGKVDIAGDTMTGQLTFDGTDHAGIKLLSLTTAERDALTPAEGVAIYNETDSVVQVYQSSAWVSIGVASAPALDDVTDVTITTPADNELLAYDSGSGEWINQTAEEAGLGGGTAGDIAFTPAGNIAATDVQAAIEELDSEKSVFPTPVGVNRNLNRKLSG
jgi:hypothetical protein